MKSRHAARTMLVLLASVLLSGAAALIPAAHAGTRFKVLHTFTGGKDGAGPMAGLIKDEAGNLYGTTYDGGHGHGTVFKLAPDGTETVLYAFKDDGGDGVYPEAGLIEDRAGNLYGTTYSGGGPTVSGTVFRVAPDGTERALYIFGGYNYYDGAHPAAGLVQDRAGNIYGTTERGGNLADLGIVFRLTPDGTETILHSFTGAPDGAHPEAGLIRDKAGNLYGTTSAGGANGGWGTVFKLAPDGSETVLYAFAGGSDGAYPAAGVIRDKAGNLYGTTLYGGTGNNFGTAFKLAPDGTKTELHAFSGGSDGAYPKAALIQDKEGNLYGTTEQGGGNGCHLNYGCGTIFKLDPDGTETVLYAFHKRRDGSLPYASLMNGRNDKLYGTASEGGGTGCKHGCGTVFRLRK